MLIYMLLQIKFSTSLSSLPTFSYSVSEVKNERNCNASFIFAPVSALESIYATSQNSGTIINFSEQWVLSNLNSSSCAGGSVFDTLEFLNDIGTYYEAVYPYYGQFINLGPVFSKVFKPSSYTQYYPTTQTEFLDIIRTKSAIVRLYYDNSTTFLNYKGGNYLCSNNFADMHYMLAVHQIDAESQGIVYLKNNWGVGWGNQGYLVLNLSSTNKMGPCNLFEEVYQINY